MLRIIFHEILLKREKKWGKLKRKFHYTISCLHFSIRACSRIHRNTEWKYANYQNVTGLLQI